MTYDPSRGAENTHFMHTGYVCMQCGTFVSSGTTHFCVSKTPTPPNTVPFPYQSQPPTPWKFCPHCGKVL